MYDNLFRLAWFLFYRFLINALRKFILHFYIIRLIPIFSFLFFCFLFQKTSHVLFEDNRLKGIYPVYYFVNYFVRQFHYFDCITYHIPLKIVYQKFWLFFSNILSCKKHIKIHYKIVLGNCSPFEKTKVLT